jgi:SAM-dependent methyltransferase
MVRHTEQERSMTPLPAPSPWLTRWANLIPTAGTVLDVAAGRGRHTRFLLAQGYPVTAIDIDVTRLADLAGQSRVTILQADLEADPWPLADRHFAGIVVINYLWRPLLPILIDRIAPGGMLIYETFAVGQERFGKPSNPDYLLRTGELLELVRGRLEVRGYEHGEDGQPARAMRQRIAAVRPAGGA